MVSGGCCIQQDPSGENKIADEVIVPEARHMVTRSNPISIYLLRVQMDVFYIF